jgi:hypothetical protein
MKTFNEARRAESARRSDKHDLQRTNALKKQIDQNRSVINEASIFNQDLDILINEAENMKWLITAYFNGELFKTASIRTFYLT